MTNRFLCAAVLLAMVGCGAGERPVPSGSGACNAICVVPGITLDVVDVSSGAPVAGATASGAGLTCTSEPATGTQPSTVDCAAGSAGNYAIDVAAPTYHPVRITIEVGAGPAPCNCIERTQVTVGLVRNT